MAEEITYGSQITINLCQDPQLFITNLNTSLCLQRFNVPTAKLDFERCVFRIVPVLNHEWVEQLIGLDLMFVEQNTLAIRRQLLKNLERNLDEEINSNVQCLEKVLGTSILFGSSNFHLVHMDTLRFVQIDYEGLTLIDYPNDCSVLNFQPAYQYQTQLNSVFDAETVTICAAKMMKDRRLFFKCKADLVSETIIIRSSTIPNTRWRLNIFNSLLNSSSKEYINIGDVVAINLSETNLFLNANQPYDMFRKIVENHIEEARGLVCDSLKKIIYDDLQVTFDDVVERVGVKRKQKLQSSSYWKFENTDYSGGHIEWFNFIRIRHNQSGRYLELQHGQPVLSDYATNLSLFTLIPLEQTKHLTRDSYFQIKHYSSGLYLEEQKQKKIERLTLHPQDTQANSKLLRIRKIAFEENWEIKFIQQSVSEIINMINLLDDISKIQDQKDTNAKIIFYDHYRRTIDILTYVQDFVNNKILTNLQTNWKYNIQSNVRQDQFRTEALFPLICLLLLKVQPEEELALDEVLDVDYLEDEQEFYRLIKYSSLNNQDHNKQLNYYYSKQISNLQKVIHTTILNVCRGNADNQICFFEFAPMFYKQMNKYSTFTILVTQLMENNPEIINDLSKVHVANESRETLFLKKIVQCFKSIEPPRRADLIQFLSISCSIGTQAVFANQDMIYKTLVEDKKLRNYLLTNLTYNREKGILVDCYENTGQIIQATIEQLADPSLMGFINNFQEQFDYLKAQFQLFAQLSLSRNYEPCKQFIEQFPDHALVPLLFYQKIDEDIQAYLFSLCKNLYIDREPYTIMVKPNLIRVISNGFILDQCFYDDDDDVFDKVEAEEKEVQLILKGFKTELISYLERIVQGLKEGGDKEKAYNQLTLEIIRILHMVLQFGLYQKVYDQVIIKKEDKKRINQEQRENELLSETLLTKLAFLLEYDYNYYKALMQMNIYKKHNATLIKLQALGLFKKQLKQEEKPKESVNHNRDELLKKMHNVKQVLDRFHNKTCSYQSPQSDYEVAIKTQICKIFSYTLDQRQDYLIDNTVSYFQNKYLKKVKQRKSNRQKERQAAQFVSLLREDMALPGDIIESSHMGWCGSRRTQYQEYSLGNRVRHFDTIIHRPFIDVLLVGFYFANDSILQNHIVELIERFSTQRQEFTNNLNQIQLLMTPESQQLYQILYMLIQKLKNHVQDSQIWLQLDTAIQINSRNEEVMERVLDKLFEIQNILQKGINEGNDKQIRRMFLNIGGFTIVQKLIYKCLALIDLNLEIFEQYEFDDLLYYKQELAQKITTIFQACVKILGLAVRNDPQNQQLVFQRLGRMLIRYTTINLGQIELINDLFSSNQSLIPLVVQSDFNNMLAYIRYHGKYHEFLEFFLSIVKVNEYVTIQQQLLTCMLLGDFQELDPFTDSPRQEGFFNYQPNIEKYKQKFLIIMELILVNDVGVSLITKLLDSTHMDELFLYLLEKAQDMRNPSLETSIQENIITIKQSVCIIIVTLIKQKKKLLLENQGLFLQIIIIESQWLQQQVLIESKAKYYITNVLLPLINLFNEYYNKKNLIQSQNPQIKAFAEQVLKCYEDLIDLKNPQIIYQIHRLLKAFQLPIPYENQDTEQVSISQGCTSFKQLENQEHRTEESETNQDCEFETWELFKLQFTNSPEVQKTLQINRLPQAIWQVSQSYIADSSEAAKSELLLNNSDLIAKLVQYLQFWKSNKSNKYSVIFTLRLLIQILRLHQDSAELFDKIGCTKAIIQLIQDENESENDYIKELLVMLNMLIQSQRVQTNTMHYLQTSISADRFFQKFEQLLQPDQDKELSTLVLKLIQKMCSDFNAEIQQLFRYQKNNKKSHDLVSQTIGLLIKSSNNQYTFNIQCLDTLFYLTSGQCQLNQIVICNSKFVEMAIRILNDMDIDGLELHQIVQIKYKVLKILMALTEGGANDEQIILTLRRIMPVTVLQSHFLKVYKHMCQLFGEDKYTRKIYKQNEEFILESGCLAYYLYCILKGDKYSRYEDDLEEFEDDKKSQLVQDFFKDNILNELTKFGQSLMQHGIDQFNQIIGGRVEEQIRIIRKQEELHKSLLFYRRNTLKIEYVRDGKLCNIYFPKLPCFYFLSQEIKTDFRTKIEGTGAKTKLTSLISMSDQLFKIMKHQELLSEFFVRQKILNIFARRVKLWSQLAFYNGLAINFFIITSYTQLAYPEETNQATILHYRLNEPRFLSDPQNYNTLGLILTLGYLNLCFNFLIVFFYLIDKAPVKIGYIWKSWSYEQSTLGIILSAILKILLSIIALIFDFDILYYIWQIIANIIGIVFHPFFFAFHLLDVLYLGPLIPILMAVWHAKVKFISIWIIAVLFEYYIALISYVYFHEFFIKDKENLCDSLWKCVYVTFDWTFKTDGSVGGRFEKIVGIEIEEQYLSSYNNYYGRFFYDNINNFIIKLCLVNILLAVIISSFSELRARNKKAKKYQNHVCFICGIDRYIFDRNQTNKSGFYYHIKQEHYAYNYLFYICYLKQKDMSLFDGNDAYIAHKIEKCDISWFPIKRAISLTEKQLDIQLISQQNKQIQSRIAKIFTSLRRKFIAYAV